MEQELARGMTVYLYLTDANGDGDPEHYMERFPHGTPAIVQNVTTGAFQDLDVDIAAENWDGVDEEFSVRRDEVALSLRGPVLSKIPASLRESIEELRLAEAYA